MQVLKACKVSSRCGFVCASLLAHIYSAWHLFIPLPQNIIIIICILKCQIFWFFWAALITRTGKTGFKPLTPSPGVWRQPNISPTPCMNYSSLRNVLPRYPHTQRATLLPKNNQESRVLQLSFSWYLLSIRGTKHNVILGSSCLTSWRDLIFSRNPKRQEVQILWHCRVVTQRM